jgi:hypothetical protein
MSTLNLLEGNDFSKEVNLEPASESLLDDQQIQPQEAKEQPAIAVEKTEEHAEPETSQDKKQYEFRRSSPWPIVAGIAGVLIIALTIIYYPRGSSDEKANDQTQPESSQQTTSQPELEQPEDQQAGDPVDVSNTADSTTEEDTGTESTEKSVAPTALDNKRQQDFSGAIFLDNVLSSMPSGVKLSFFRYANEGYLAELVSESESLFSDLENSLDRISAETLSKALSQEKQIGTSTVLVRQIQGVIPSLKTAIIARGLLEDSQIQSGITAIANQSNLQIRQIDVSSEKSAGSTMQRPVTIKLAGTQTSVVNFIQDLLRSYQNIGLNKITITQSTRDLSNPQVNSVLDLDVFRNIP